MGKLNLEACKNTEKAQNFCAFSLFEVVRGRLTFKHSNLQTSNPQTASALVCLVVLGTVKKRSLAASFFFCYLYQTNGIRR